MKIMQKNNILYSILMLIVFGLALFIRFHNISHYNTYWADDGGGHVDYVYQIEENHRLPEFKDNYLAWHEPGYYILAAFWNFFRPNIDGLYFEGINWTECLNVLIYIIFMVFVWIFAFMMSKKNKWIALSATFLFSVLFIGVKLSAYINNELLNQATILLLIILFLYWKLLDDYKYKKVILFATILSFATMIKMTALIVLLGVSIIWFLSFVLQRKKYFIFYILIVISIFFVSNAPWLIHKVNTYGNAFAINTLETEKNNVFRSDAWYYVFRINTDIFYKNPYLTRELNSYFAILLSDTFSDHYNLFNNPDKMVDRVDKIMLNNNRFTNQKLWNAMLNVNKVGFVIFAIWLVGFIFFMKDFIFNFIKYKKIDYYEAFLLIVLLGAWFALLYNNLCYPYLHRGVLKGHFIYYSYPLFVTLSYISLYKHIANKFLYYLLVIVPIIIYIIIAWPILYVA